MQYEQLYSQNNLSYHSLRNLGFEEGPQSQFPVRLYRADLSKQTASLRDTLSLAMLNFQKLQNILLSAGSIQSWQFCHVVICSTSDRISSARLQDVIAFIGRARLQWKCRFRCFVIGVDIEDDGRAAELQELCEAGGDQWKMFSSDYAGFLQLFKRVAGQLGIGGKRSLLGSQQSIHVKVQEPMSSVSLALTISIEGTAKFKGQKWQSMANILSFYLRNLGSKDIVSGIIYNNKPWLLAQPAPPAPIAQANQAPNQNMGNPNAAIRNNVIAVQPRNRSNRIFYCICITVVVLLIRFLIVIAATS